MTDMDKRKDPDVDGVEERLENGTAAKRIKMDSTNGSIAEVQEPNGSGSMKHVNDVFKNIEFVKVLKADAARKTVFIHGKHQDGRDAVIILEHYAFNTDKIENVFQHAVSGDLELKNDIYSGYRVFLDHELNGVKATIIHPAEKTHLEKYSQQIAYLIEETAEDYERMTLPCIKKTKRFATTWVDNVLAHETESERIVFEDPDKELGFILLPDLKWDGKNVGTLYLIALTHKHILSIRELTGGHLPMLKNIKEKGTKAIVDKFGLAPSRIRIFFHYQPTFYHLHIHFTNIQFDAPGSNVEKAHMLASVISNLENDPEYYKKVTIPFLIREQDPLFFEYSSRLVENKSTSE